MGTQWVGSDRRSRLPADWPAIRRAVLDRDNGWCRLRYDRCTVTATDVDHVVRGDDHRLVNLQAVCGSCHRAKTSAEGNAARARERRPTLDHPGLI